MVKIVVLNLSVNNNKPVFLNGPFTAIFFFIFVFSIHSWQLTNVQYINKVLPMTGFEPQTSGIGSDHSTNWATTTAHKWHHLNLFAAQVSLPNNNNSQFIGATLVTLTE